MTQPPKPAQACNLSRQSIESIAELFAKKFNYSPETQLNDLVNHFGGKISYKDFTQSPEGGSVIIKSEQDFEIFLPNHTSALRNRFTVAHELGHYVLHYLWKKINTPNLGAIYATRYGSNRAEWEANWFASALLMSSVDMKHYWTNNSKSIADIACNFNVSIAAAKLRVRRLGLIVNDNDEINSLNS